MKKVIEFETRLANFTEPDEDKRDEEKSYHIMPISELQNLAPFVCINMSYIIFLFQFILLNIYIF